MNPRGFDRTTRLVFTRRATIAMLAMTGFALAARPGLAQSPGNAPHPFTQEAFDAAQKAGKPILVETFATWCDVCARQAPILATLRSDKKYRDLVTFTVDFDTQKDVMRKFNARMQSTLICFRGAKEVGRSVGETQGEWIDDMLQKTLHEGAS